MTMIQELENRLHYYNMDINVYISMVFKSSWNFELGIATQTYLSPTKKGSIHFFCIQYLSPLFLRWQMTFLGILPHFSAKSLCFGDSGSLLAPNRICPKVWYHSHLYEVCTRIMILPSFMLFLRGEGSIIGAAVRVLCQL